MLFCTIAANNYLAEAMTLAKSLRAHHKGATVILAQPEQQDAVASIARASFDSIVTPECLHYPNLNAFAFLHDVTELATAMKPRVLRHLLNHFPDDDIIYIDPDCLVYSAFREVIEQLRGGDEVIVTPHHLVDENTFDGIRDNGLRTLKCGIFNLGFLALRGSPIAEQLLDWWINKVDMLCYIDFERGLFVDQKWFDLAMVFFPLTVLRHPGYNVANWNVSKRLISSSNGQLLVNGLPLSSTLAV
jgi:hypothetical protein